MSAPNSYRTDPPADQEKARMLALDWIEGKALRAPQVDYICRAFLELATGPDGPKELLKMPGTQEILLAAGEMKPNELAAVKAVLRWYVGRHNNPEEHGSYNATRESK